MAGSTGAKRGRRLKPGKGWRLTSPGRGKPIKASLLKKLTVGGERLAIFRII